MDELVIDDKKYISSKRAAKITGYAKDYVGQLCREGRVSARLVGRSWYVLESAIQDHRFGNPAEEGDGQIQTPVESPGAALELNSARYEPSSAGEDLLPPINLLQAAKQKEDATTGQPEGALGLHEAWSTWFDSFGGHNDEETAPVVAQESKDTRQDMNVSEEGPVEEAEIEQEVPVAFTVVTTPRMGEIAAKGEGVATEKLSGEGYEEPANTGAVTQQLTTRQGKGVVARMLIVSGLLLLMAVSAIIGVLGSGFLDGYAYAVGRAGILAGVSYYGK